MAIGNAIARRIKTGGLCPEVMIGMYYGIYPQTHAVELFDQVEVRIHGRIYEGVVTKLHPRSSEVTVRYKDDLDARRDGQPRRKTARAHLLSIELLARDG